jgi:hypothetical protein
MIAHVLKTCISNDLNYAGGFVVLLPEDFGFFD